MKKWEEEEFEEQQEAIRLWAKKKYIKMLNGWWLNRKLNKLERIAEIITGKSNLVAYIRIKERKKVMKDET